MDRLCQWADNLYEISSTTRAGSPTLNAIHFAAASLLLWSTFRNLINFSFIEYQQEILSVCLYFPSSRPMSMHHQNSIEKLHQRQLALLNRSIMMKLKFRYSRNENPHMYKISYDNKNLNEEYKY